MIGNRQMGRREIKSVTVLALSFLLGMAVTSTAKEIGHGSSLNRARNIHDGNLIRVTFHNFGMMGGQKGDQSQIYAGEWPIGSGLAQMGNASAYAMARLRVPAGIDTTTGDTLYDYVTPVIFCEGWDPALFSHDSLGVFQGFEPLPGYLNVAQKEKDPMHAVAMSHMAYTWPPFWPDKLEDPFDPGWSGHWNGYFGKDQMNADQESYFVLDDYQYKKRVRGIALPKPVPEEPNRGGLGLRMSVRGLQWSNPDAQDCIFWLYDIRNIGQLYLDQALFGLNVGASSGALVTDNTDWDDDVARYYRERALAVNYDYDNVGTRGYSPVPWVGFAFLESPGNPYDGIDNDGDGINGGGKLISTDEFLKSYAVGDRIVLIDYWSGRYERTVTTMPPEGVRFQVNGITYIKRPNAPLQEIPRNLIDDNLNGLIDESDGAVTQDSIPYYLYIRDPIYNNRDYLAKDYLTGAGLDNPLIDERRDDGIDNDGDWNAAYDDVGMDGKPGTGDTGEGDGLPTPGRGELPGEPNVDLVDVDESDQIGLTSFKFYEYGDVTYSNDDQMWEISRPGYFDLGSRERADFDYVFASGYFPLMPNQKEFFSVAMLFGWDEREILYNKEIVQKIYNSNYNFAVAPKKPVLRAVAGDRKVTLYWDSEAELSFDRYLHEYDFEGYKIYRATAPTFEDAGSITDGYGYDRFKVPIAVFDKVDGIYGFFPLTFGTGVQFYLGAETGLTHTFVDSPLVNGMTYYYAVTAYDRGSVKDNIGPTETTIFISVDQAGNVRAGENVVVVTPQPPSLGYVPPGFDVEPKPVGQLVTNGRVAVRIVNPSELVDGDEYEVQFLDCSMDHRDNDLDGKVDAEDKDEWLPNQTTGFVLRNLTRNTSFDTVWLYEQRLEGDSVVQVRNLYDDRDGDPRTFRALLGPLEIFAYNPPGGVVHDPQRNIRNGIRWSQNIDYSTAYHLRFSLFDMKGFKPGIFYPRQYMVVFYDELVTRTKRIGVPLETTGKLIPVPETHVNYKIFDAATGEEVPFAAVDATVDRNLTPPGFFSAKDRVIFFETLPNDSVVITFSLLNNDVQDTVFFRNYGRRLGAGDTLWLFPDFPFTGSVRYRFKVRGEKLDVQYARSHLDRIKVVPNPYVVTAVWEPLNPYTSGRGPRKVEFIHLPPRCTIRIYAVDGTLVKTLEHNSPLSDGSESWDLMTKDNMDLAYGVYIYHVDAPGIGQHTGRLLIIK